MLMDDVLFKKSFKHFFKYALLTTAGERLGAMYE